MSSLSRIGTKDGASIWAGALPKGRNGASMSVSEIEAMLQLSIGCRCLRRRRRTTEMIDTGDLTMYCHWDKGLVCKKEFYCDIRRCDDARHHRSCERPGGAGHWHKGADRSGFGAIRRYPCGVGRGSAANIPANADWRDCQPTGWQEEVRTDWGELLRRFRN